MTNFKEPIAGRTHPASWLAAIVFCGLIGSHSSLFAQASDTIFQVSGGNVRGKITSVTPTSITVSVSNVQRKVPVTKIDRIVLGDMPSKMKRAAEEAGQQQYQQALDRLKEVQLESRDRKVLQQEYKFLTAYCTAELALRGNGNPSNAVKMMIEFIKEHKNSYHYYDALQTVGDLAVAMGRYDKAITSYAMLSRAPVPQYKARGLSLEAKALQSSGKPQEALAKYNEVLQLPTDDPEARRQNTMAVVGKAACMAELGQHKKAVADIKRVIDENDPADQELFARTYNALGTCHRKAEQPMDAVLAYMRTHLLFSSNADSHAEALFHLTSLWPLVDQPEKGAQYREILKTRYAGTAWAQRN